ncbi:MAG: TSUP family transporter [Nitrospirales bacterium]|nr:TSUP family transporter [Nitrospira sp.]MDR4500161.1 TSUP family transporter [Nitrospirales bacterium]
MVHTLLNFNTIELLLVGFLFIWTGFVRSGLGFGGAALGLPLMLFLHDQPLFWLPIIGTHLLFFSALTLRTRLHNVNWNYLRKTSFVILPTTLMGVLGLISLPTTWLLIFIYTVSLGYGLMWLLNMTITSHEYWSDTILLALGGYVAGTSLTGGPLMVAVAMKNVTPAQLRNTLYVLWFTIVTIKMSTFVALRIELHLFTALTLLPVAAIGHLIGLKFHDEILKHDRQFRQVVGGVLTLISGLGLFNKFV